MKIFLIIILFITGCTPIISNIKKNTPKNKIENIKYFKWKNRILIIFDDKKQATKKLNKFSGKFEERDIIIILMKDNNSFINNTLMNDKFHKSITKKIKNINKQHKYILIGKDGSIKKTYPSDVIIDKILSKVDSMPMRIKEAKKIN